MDPQETQDNIVGVGEHNVSGSVKLADQFHPVVELENDNAVQANLQHKTGTAGPSRHAQVTPQVACVRVVRAATSTYLANRHQSLVAEMFPALSGKGSRHLVFFSHILGGMKADARLNDDDDIPFSGTSELEQVAVVDADVQASGKHEQQQERQEQGQRQ